MSLGGNYAKGILERFKQKSNDFLLGSFLQL